MAGRTKREIAEQWIEATDRRKKVLFALVQSVSQGPVKVMPWSEFCPAASNAIHNAIELSGQDSYIFALHFEDEVLARLYYATANYSSKKNFEFTKYDRQVRNLQYVSVISLQSGAEWCQGMPTSTRQTLKLLGQIEAEDLLTRLEQIAWHDLIESVCEDLPK